MNPTIGSLFAGIGGFDLGFQRAGFDIGWQVEIDPWCRKVLAKHWPKVPRFEDVREVGAHNLPPVDVVCGGFPCQDLSTAGKQKGLNGERSGLWFEMCRITSELRPQFLVVENVPGLLTNGMDRVLGSLAEIGYDALWKCISAADMGAPHKRKRIFIVAYPNSNRLERWHSGQNAEIPIPALVQNLLGADIPQRRFDRMDDGVSAQLDGGLNESSTKSRPTKTLPSMWQPLVKEAVRLGAFGGHGALQEKEILQQGMSKAGPNETRSDSQTDNGFQGAKIQEDLLRTLWSGGSATCPPRRQEHPKQSASQSLDPLRNMPQPTSRREVDRLRGLGNAIVPQIAELLAHTIKPHLQQVTV